MTVVLAHSTPNSQVVLDDRQLLRAYAESGSGEAFRQLVDRHIALVHAAAMRRCGNDSHRASDVTQIVFMALAQKARQIGPGVILSGWLIRATYFTARSLHRAEARRQRHEARAAVLRDREAAMKQPDQEARLAEAPSGMDLWERISPLLDEALAHLPSAARDVLVLRFLEGRSYADVGARLGVTEEAARKRAERGLGSLRHALKRLGITTYDQALGIALQSAVAPPVSLELTHAVSSCIGTAHRNAHIVKGVVKLMAWTKAKIATAAVAAALLAGGGGLVAQRLIRPSNDVRVVSLSGNAPEVPVPVQQVPAPYSLTERATVRNVAGEPVVGAPVLVLPKNSQSIGLTSDPQMGPPTAPRTLTSSEGSFEIAGADRSAGALVLAPDGAVEASADDLARHATLTLQPYGRIEGTVLVDHRPVATNSQILVSNFFKPRHGVIFEMRARTDALGHFSIEKVPAAEYFMMLGPNNNGEISVAPGTTARADVDRPRGHPIVGTIEGVQSRSNAVFLFTTFESREASSRPAGIFVHASWQFNVDPDADGHFRIEQVPPGVYHLSVSVMSPRSGAGTTTDVTITAPLEGETPAAIDLGKLKLKRF